MHTQCVNAPACVEGLGSLGFSESDCKSVCACVRACVSTGDCWRMRGDGLPKAGWWGDNSPRTFLT